jgi:hypothetical protein
MGTSNGTAKAVPFPKPVFETYPKPVFETYPKPVFETRSTNSFRKGVVACHALAYEL